MKRYLLAAALLVSFIATAAIGFLAGREVAAADVEVARLAADVRTHDRVDTDLASADALTRETALWYRAGAVLYGTDAWASMLGEGGRARELMLAYARLAQHAAKDHDVDRTRRLLGRAEQVWTRHWGPAPALRYCCSWSA
jgi:hypothetical protein